MRVLTLASLALIMTELAAGGASTPETDRTRVIAALQRLMTTGEPRHIEHDEGQWLQNAVNAAFARHDAEIERLAQRAAMPLLARVTSPVSSTRDLPSLSIEMWTVLKVPKPHTYTAAIAVSVDGGDLVSIGTFSKGQGGTLRTMLPAIASAAGLHHLRLRAVLTFANGSGLAPETRDLPEIVYALYDERVNKPGDARFFIESVASVSAQRLDGALPPVRFDAWLRQVVLQHGGEGVETPAEWRTAYCDERLLEAGIHPRTRDLCVVADIYVRDGLAGVGHVWIRTGRVELTDTDVRWLAETPSFEGLMLRGVEIETLSALPDILETPADRWPVGDAAVAPEDMTLTVRGNSVHVEAVVRNTGTAKLHNVMVMVSITADGTRDVRRNFVVDVPRNGATTVTANLPLLDRYGAVVVHAMEMGEHALPHFFVVTLTQEDSLAFRIINPAQAPKGYAQWLRAQCGPVCRVLAGGQEKTCRRSGENRQEMRSTRETLG
jgi:hypothetical protein